METRTGVDYTMRAARHGDVLEIQSFSLELDRPAGSESFLHHCIDDPLRRIVVAFDGAAIIGWAKTHHYDETEGPAPAGHYLGGVSVHPAYYRRGLGTRLSIDRLEWIWRRESTAYYIANQRNAASRELHQLLGFAEVICAPRLHGLEFDGGVGVLYRATRPEGPPARSTVAG